MKALSFSPTGALFLCVCGNWQAKIYDRDGLQKQETIRGDMYIRDMANTKGHVAGLTDGSWHPNNKNVFITSSLDCTVRTFDLDTRTVGVERQLMQVSTIKAKNQKTSMKTAVTTCTYSADGRMIGGGCADGSIQCWQEKSYMYRPDFIVNGAHANGSVVSCVRFFSDGRRAASRATDDTLKLWDLRRTS